MDGFTCFTMTVCVLLLRCSSLGLASDSNREYFSVHPASQNVTEGSNATFMCETTDEIECKSGSVIHWAYATFENVDSYVGLSVCGFLYKNTAYKHLYTVNWTSSRYFLHLLNVTSDSNGVYFCYLNAFLNSDYAHLHVIKPLESSPRPNSTTTTPTCRPQQDDNLQCNFSPSNPREGEQISLRCRQQVGGQNTLTWSSENLTLASLGGETLSRENFHNVTHVLGKDDNCARFTCLAQSNANDGGVSQCEVIPLMFPVSLSPSILPVVENSMGMFHCDTDSLTIADYKWFVRTNSSDNPPQAVEETDQFEVLEAGKSLKVNALSAADNGTEVRCVVEYQPNCSQSSPWSVLLISASRMTTPSSDSAYTHLSSDPSSSNELSNFLGLIIGGGVALLFLLAIIGGVLFYLLRDHKPPNEQPTCPGRPSSCNIYDVEMVGLAERNPTEPTASVRPIEGGEAIYAVSSKHKSFRRPMTSHEQDIEGFQDDSDSLRPAPACRTVPERMRVGEDLYTMLNKQTRQTTVNQVSESTASSSCPNGDHHSTDAEQTLPAASIQHCSTDDLNAPAIAYAELELGGHPRTDLRKIPSRGRKSATSSVHSD